ncbi:MULTISPECIES: SAM-dependent methyltransferase [unclassified Streptomyces]|uniref:SAM-dependent methyltransferase n=1 Tax=unclassified Streptomyces TaxID=2593676 RepID=UPI0036EC8E6E
MAETNEPSGVGQTGIGVALSRALESDRPDRLFNDQVAKLFLEAVGYYRNITAVAVRTRYFDDALLAASEHCLQVVLLASGLDARAFRLPWPAGTKLFEIDLPKVLEFKEKVISKNNVEPTCERQVLAVDLRTDWPEELKKNGFDPSLPTAWLAEGLLVYLAPEDVDTLVSRITELSRPGSRFIFDRHDMKIIEHHKRQLLADVERQLYKSGISGHPAEWLEPLGWKTEASLGTEMGKKYGREFVVEVGSGWLATAVRQ